MTDSPSRVDRWIEAVAPVWALRRQQARLYSAYLKTLSPLSSDRGTGTVPNNPTNVDDKIPWHDRMAMCDLFDTEFLESPLLAGMADQFVRNVVPAQGLRPIPDTGNADLDKVLADRYDARAEACEIRGHSMAQFQQILTKSVMGHGDAAVFHLPDGSLQGIPACKIATPSKYGRLEGTAVHQGVYTGAGTAPRGYYTIPRDSLGGYRWNDARYLDASQVWFFARPDDFESYRGRSAFLAAFPHLRMVKSILKYKEFQTKMASVFGIAIVKSAAKSTSPLSRLGTSTSAAEARGEAKTTDTRADIELFSGMGITLNPDEDIKTIDAKLQSGDFGEFVRLVATFIGVSCGLPLEFVLLDWSRGNYYGNRMAAQAGKRAFLDWWSYPARLTKLAWRTWVQGWIDDGTVVLPSGVDPARVLTCTVTLPPPIEVDEEKDLKVVRMKLESNLGTGEDYARQQGTTLQRIIDARARELTAMKAAGLPIVASTTPGVKLLSELEQQAPTP